MADDRQDVPAEEAPAPRGWLDAPRALAAALRQRLMGLRPWIARHRRLATGTALGLFLFASAALTIWYIQTSRERALAEGLTLKAAFEKLDSGEYEEARRLAHVLQISGQLPFDDFGGPPFVQGAAIIYETDQAWDEPRRAEYYLLAAKYLQQSREHGFPPARDAEGLLLLARSLQEAGRYTQSIPVLLELIETGPAMAGPARSLLAAAYVRSIPPQPLKAKQYCDELLAATTASPAEREQVTLLAAEIALAQDDHPQCAQWLAKIPDSSKMRAEALVLHGQMLLAEADALDEREAQKPPSEEDESPQVLEHGQESKALRRRAIESLRQASAAAPHNVHTGPQAAYLIGVALRKLNELPAAQQQFSSMAKSHNSAPVSLLAGLEDAEVLMELGRIDESLRAYERTIRSAGAPAQFTNRWITVAQLRERVEAGYTAMVAANRHDLAAKLSRDMPPLFEVDRALELRAKAHHGWASYLAHQSERSTGADQPSRLPLARRHFRQAGVEYARLAHLHYTMRRYPDDLWLAGQSFALGHDFESAIVVLREYLDTEARKERPLVMVVLGEAYLSLGDTDQAITVLEDCLRDFSKDPANYKARLLASQAHVEMGNRDRAIELLWDNLHHESLTPRSDAWCDSLFALGKVLHDEGLAVMGKQNASQISGTPSGRSISNLEAGYETLQEAVRRLSEAVARYPDDPRTPMALYLMAESQRHAARLPLTKLETETIESRRLVLNRQAREQLTGALETYDRLVARFNNRSESETLSPVEESTLRNAYFARGTTFYELGSYEDAITAYSTATSRYQQEPAAVEAYVQIAACFRRLNKPAEARGTLEQAKLVMDRIAPNTDFTVTTRFDRQEWAALLDWMSTL